MDKYPHLHLKWVTNKDLLQSTGSSAQCYVTAWMGGEFGGERIHVYVWLNPFNVHLKLLQYCLLVGYTSIQNKELKDILLLRFYLYNSFQEYLLRGIPSLHMFEESEHL